MEDLSHAKRGGLERDSVVATALDLLDEVGLDGLTVRRLATELGVKSPALYWHFRDKQELLDLMSQRLQAEQGMAGPRDGEPWPEWIARRAHERRSLLLSRRDGARLVSGTSPGPAAARMFDAELGVLTGFGFTPVQAMRAVIAIGHYITGFVLEEQAAQERRNRAESGADERRGRRGREEEAAPRERLPVLGAAIREGGPPEGPEAFEQGLRMLVDGMQALTQAS
ncbi:TetR/AcrR family transcriptional regulator C-terminal domain-containing protein [Saccharopolyspora shandongensis]|uniref:TetR/AcrR family transcriptional regulator C-terminal domain-containing protein n=1 Tax=Saccharopolyspora shandongensis TaxID=418495 RepID=UPI0033E98119